MRFSKNCVWYSGFYVLSNPHVTPLQLDFIFTLSFKLDLQKCFDKEKKRIFMITPLGVKWDYYTGPS